VCPQNRWNGIKTAGGDIWLPLSMEYKRLYKM
jgi:hypothetical protein